MADRKENQMKTEVLTVILKLHWDDNQSLQYQKYYYALGLYLLLVLLTKCLKQINLPQNNYQVVEMQKLIVLFDQMLLHRVDFIQNEAMTMTNVFFFIF